MLLKTQELVKAMTASENVLNPELQHLALYLFCMTKQMHH